MTTEQGSLTAKVARAVSDNTNAGLERLLKQDIDELILEAAEQGDYSAVYYSEAEKGVSGIERNIKNIYEPMGFNITWGWQGGVPLMGKKYAVISW
jgi:hypothetical protein